MEPWSIVANHPLSGEPFGLVVNDESTFAEAEHIARNMLATFRLSGAFLPTSQVHALHGHYCFTYTVSPEARRRMTTIWAEHFEDAELRLNILAADGILFMPSPG